MKEYTKGHSITTYEAGGLKVQPSRTNSDGLPSKTRHCVSYNTIDTLISLRISFLITSHEKGLITKEYIVTYTHLNFVFKWALHLSTYVSNKTFKQWYKSYNCYRNTTNQSPFKCFAAHTTHPLLILMHSILKSG